MITPLPMSGNVPSCTDTMSAGIGPVVVVLAVEVVVVVVGASVVVVVVVELVDVEAVEFVNSSGR